jgi:23S rRNA G2445 N2-methylase RlmL
MDADRFRFFVTCARGTEGALRRELVALRIGSPKGDTGGVWFEGPLRMAMAVCLHARVAVRVLLQVATFEADSSDALYEGTRRVAWTDWLTTKSTLSVHATVRGSRPEGEPEPVATPPRDGPRRGKPAGLERDRRPQPRAAFQARAALTEGFSRPTTKTEPQGLTHSGYAALKVKDAVVDALRDKLGARPDVDPKNPDVSLVLHLAGLQAGLFLDLAGEPLHRRGYRVAMTDAPLKETLAAAVLSLGGVRGDEPFVDPMCGSGTLAIEHALAARNVPPGLRRKFGFQRWPGFAANMRADWAAQLEQARAQVAEVAGNTLAPIVCADIGANELAAARRNAAAAGVEADIQFERADVGDVGDLTRRWPTGTVCTNPPYGERLVARDLGAVYRRMASAFKRLSGWTVVVLSGNPLLARDLPIKPRISHRLFNGPLEVRLLRYEIDAEGRV